MSVIWVLVRRVYKAMSDTGAERSRWAGLVSPVFEIYLPSGILAKKDRTPVDFTFILLKIPRSRHCCAIGPSELPVVAPLVRETTGDGDGQSPGGSDCEAIRHRP